MVTYFLNCMGPVHNRYYEETGTHWRCGRIDIHNDEPYGEEDSMPLIRAEDWEALAGWLWDLETEGTLYREELLKMFEEKTGIRIRYYKDFKGGTL